MTEENINPGLGKTIRFSGDASEGYRIKAYVSVGDTGAERLIIFRRDQIDYIFAQEQKGLSGIRLHSGVEIPVRMDIEALDSAINSPDFKSGSLIDLTAVTARVVAANDVAVLPEEGKKAENSETGRLTPQGVYLGQYRPKDRAGKSLGKIFNVYAAPEDLAKTMKYLKAVKYIAKLKNWYGFDGTNYPTDTEIYAALKDGSYKGGWIIPPRDILRGDDADGKETTPDNLFDHQNKGAFKGTFKTAASSGSDYLGWYWSSTEHWALPTYARVQFSDGNVDWDYKGLNRLSCRPVRLVAASAPATG